MRLKRHSDIENAQEKTNEKYGVGEWEIVLYNGGHNPCLVKHKCGKEKELTRFSTFKLGKTKCECQHLPSNERGAGRPTLDFEELSKKISEETNSEYELLEIVGTGGKFLVNHKSCNEKPFETTTQLFFKKGYMCNCRKYKEVKNGTDNI